jgi:MoaA/NifB/PqqE/SkfB family radical SAM enzyme
MCGVVNILKGYELSLEDVKRIFDEVSDWDWDFTIVITGGEPFLRQDIFEIFNYARKFKLNIEVVSNGSLIGQEIAEKVMSSGLKNIAISLDGAKEETHDFIREKGAFRKATQAVKFISAAKKKAGFGPQISVWTTIMKENVGELFDIIALTKDIGVECLVYHPVIVAQEDMQNTSPNARFWLNHKDIEKLKPQIDKIVSYQKKNGLVAFLHDPYLWIKHFKGELTKKEWKCNPFAFINIGPDGEVRSCGSAFGNIRKLSLQECLNTEEAYRARKIMKNCAKPCLQTCWANPEADSLSGIIDTLINNIRRNKLDKKSKKELLSAAFSRLVYYEELLRKCTV